MLGDLLSVHCTCGDLVAKEDFTLVVIHPGPFTPLDGGIEDQSMDDQADRLLDVTGVFVRNLAHVRLCIDVI